MTAACHDGLFRELVETLPIVTYVVESGSNGRTLYVSPQMEQLLGYPAQDWLDDPDFFDKIVHPADRARVLPQTEARTVAEDTSSLFRVLASDGREITVQSEIVVRRDERGRPSHVFGFWIDATERVRLSAELRQSQKLEAVGRLAGGVAHDFNNVLLAQRGYGELALRHLEREDIPAARSAFDQMLAAVTRGANLTGQLLAFARRQVIDVDVLDLNLVVAEIEHFLRTLVGTGISFQIVVSPTPVWVRADRGQVEQVVTNLVVNARDAMPTGGLLRVSVAVVDEGATAVLEVADTGVGMDFATAERIFDPFFTTKGTEGTGLGLATVHGVITQAGGRIIVASTPGNGTTFTVSLPTADEPAPAQRPEPLSPHGNGETILLVDDDAAVRGAVMGMLELHGYRVNAVADADQALEIARQTSEIDLLVTDVVLPDCDGPTTADLVRALRPGLAVLYMSGHTDDVRLPELAPGTGSAFIQKPFSAAELARAVADLLAARKPSAP